MVSMNGHSHRLIHLLICMLLQSFRNQKAGNGHVNASCVCVPVWGVSACAHTHVCMHVCVSVDVGPTGIETTQTE